MTRLTYKEIVELGDYFDDVEELLDYVKDTNFWLDRLEIMPDDDALVFPPNFSMNTYTSELPLKVWVLLEQSDRIIQLKRRG